MRKRIKSIHYCQKDYKPAFSFKESGKIVKIAFSAALLTGTINNAEVSFKHKSNAQHIIEFDDDNIVLDLTIYSTTEDQTPGYVIVYKEHIDKYQKSDMQDDLEGV